MGDDTFRASQIREFEMEAELLVAHQLDFLAQIESQLRAVHQTMRRIERLRNVNSRVGPELSNGGREDVLAGLMRELNAVDEQLLVQHQSSQGHAVHHCENAGTIGCSQACCRKTLAINRSRH